MVHRIHRADNGGVNLLLLQHLLKVIGMIDGNIIVTILLFQTFAMVVGARQAEVAKTDQLGVLAILICQRINKHVDAMACSNSSVTFLVAHSEESFLCKPGVSQPQKSASFFSVRLKYDIVRIPL